MVVAIAMMITSLNIPTIAGTLPIMGSDEVISGSGIEVQDFVSDAVTEESVFEPDLDQFVGDFYVNGFYSMNGITLLGSSSRPAAIESMVGGLSYSDGTNFTYSAKTLGASDQDGGFIAFATDGAAKVTVYAAESSGNGGAIGIMSGLPSGQVAEANIDVASDYADTTFPVIYELNVLKAGQYSLVTTSSFDISRVVVSPLEEDEVLITAEAEQVASASADDPTDVLAIGETSLKVSSSNAPAGVTADSWSSGNGVTVNSSYSMKIKPSVTGTVTLTVGARENDDTVVSTGDDTVATLNNTNGYSFSVTESAVYTITNSNSNGTRFTAVTLTASGTSATEYNTTATLSVTGVEGATISDITLSPAYDSEIGFAVGTEYTVTSDTYDVSSVALTGGGTGSESGNTFTVTADTTAITVTLAEKSAASTEATATLTQTGEGTVTIAVKDGDTVEPSTEDTTTWTLTQGSTYTITATPTESTDITSITVGSETVTSGGEFTVATGTTELAIVVTFTVASTGGEESSTEATTVSFVASFDPNDETSGDITSETVYDNYFEVVPGVSSSYPSIASSKKSVSLADGTETYTSTYALKTGGNADTTKRYISFTPTSTGSVYVYAMSGGSDTRTVYMNDGTENVQSGSVDNSGVQEIIFNITSTGVEHKIYSGTSTYIYYIGSTATLTDLSSGSTEPSYANAVITIVNNVSEELTDLSNLVITATKDSETEGTTGTLSTSGDTTTYTIADLIVDATYNLVVSGLDTAYQALFSGGSSTTSMTIDESGNTDTLTISAAETKEYADVAAASTGTDGRYTYDFASASGKYAPTTSTDNGAYVSYDTDDLYAKYTDEGVVITDNNATTTTPNTITYTMPLYESVSSSNASKITVTGNINLNGANNAFSALRLSNSSGSGVVIGNTGNGVLLRAEGSSNTDSEVVTTSTSFEFTLVVDFTSSQATLTIGKNSATVSISDISDLTFTKFNSATGSTATNTTTLSNIVYTVTEPSAQTLDGTLVNDFLDLSNLSSTTDYTAVTSTDGEIVMYGGSSFATTTSNIGTYDLPSGYVLSDNSTTYTSTAGVQFGTNSTTTNKYKRIMIVRLAEAGKILIGEKASSGRTLTITKFNTSDESFGDTVETFTTTGSLVSHVTTDTLEAGTYAIYASNTIYVGYIATTSSFTTVNSTEDTYTISGTVTDSDGNAVSGIELTLYNSSNAVVATTTSASDGTFSFTYLPADTYHITSTATDKYASATENGIELSSETDYTNDQYIIFEHTGSITVSASLDCDEEVLAGLTVYIDGTDFDYTGTLSSTGTVTVGNIASDTYSVYVEGYATKAQSVTVDGDAQTVNFEFETTYYTVTVTVDNQTDSAQTVTIKKSSSDTASDVTSVAANTQSEYTVDLEAGDYSIVLASTDTLSVNGFVVDSTTTAVSTTITSNTTVSSLTPLASNTVYAFGSEADGDVNITSITNDYFEIDITDTQSDDGITRGINDEYLGLINYVTTDTITFVLDEAMDVTFVTGGKGLTLENKTTGETVTISKGTTTVSLTAGTWVVTPASGKSGCKLYSITTGGEDETDCTLTLTLNKDENVTGTLSVAVSDSSTSYTVTDNSDGTYTVTGLKSGTYTITVTDANTEETITYTPSTVTIEKNAETAAVTVDVSIKTDPITVNFVLLSRQNTATSDKITVNETYTNSVTNSTAASYTITSTATTILDDAQPGDYITFTSSSKQIYGILKSATDSEGSDDAVLKAAMKLSTTLSAGNVFKFVVPDEAQPGDTLTLSFLAESDIRNTEDKYYASDENNQFSETYDYADRWLDVSQSTIGYGQYAFGGEKIALCKNNARSILEYQGAVMTFYDITKYADASGGRWADILYDDDGNELTGTYQGYTYYLDRKYAWLADGAGYIKLTIDSNLQTVSGVTPLLYIDANGQSSSASVTTTNLQVYSSETEGYVTPTAMSGTKRCFPVTSGATYTISVKSGSDATPVKSIRLYNPNNIFSATSYNDKDGNAATLSYITKMGAESALDGSDLANAFDVYSSSSSAVVFRLIGAASPLMSDSETIDVAISDVRAIGWKIIPKTLVDEYISSEGSSYSPGKGSTASDSTLKANLETWEDSTNNVVLTSDILNAGVVKLGIDNGVTGADAYNYVDNTSTSSAGFIASELIVGTTDALTAVAEIKALYSENFIKIAADGVDGYTQFYAIPFTISAVGTSSESGAVDGYYYYIDDEGAIYSTTDNTSTWASDVGAVLLDVSA